MSQLRLGFLSSPKHHCDLDLIAFLQETLDMANLEVVVVNTDFWSELYLFDLNLLLVFFGFMGFLVQFIEVFSIIHDAADRRIGLRCHFDQVQIPLLGQIQSFRKNEDPELLFIFVDDPYLLCVYPFVYPMGLR